MSTRHPARPRRIDDALSQLVDSLTPTLPLGGAADTHRSSSADDDAADALAAAEERRQRQNLERAWRTLDSHPSLPHDPSSPTGPAALGLGGSRAGGIGPDSINNASDLIKRKLLRENATPDKAVRFSNLYSRLLTQPVLSQKWAILYLLYRLSSPGEDEYEGERVTEYDEGERSRSPLMEEGNLQSILMKGTRRGESSSARGIMGMGTRSLENSEDEGPAVSSSASQRPARHERAASSLRHDWGKEDDRASGSPTEKPRESRPSRIPGMDAAGNDRSVEENANKRFSDRGDGGQKLTAPPHEQGLLRDLPYNLQGLSSSHLEFASPSILKLPPALPIPIISLLNALAEPCLLYRGLSDFVESSGGGLVSQSLQSALSNELRSYLGLVATLEGEIRRALSVTKDSDEPSVCKGGVTLKRCVVWTRDATMALRLMSLIVEESRSKPLSPYDAATSNATQIKREAN